MMQLIKKKTQTNTITESIPEIMNNLIKRNASKQYGSIGVKKKLIKSNEILFQQFMKNTLIYFLVKP